MDSDSRQAILGSIDFIDHVQIRGWAKDDRSSKSAVKLVIIVADKMLGRLTADLFRQDLKDAGIGNGCHAFEFIFPTTLPVNSAHIVHVRTDDGRELPGSPFVLDALHPAHTATGNIDLFDHRRIAGWAVGPQQSPDPTTLLITDKDRLLGRIVANTYRADLQAAGIGIGQHAFEFEFPTPLPYLESHLIRVRRELDGLDVPGSPMLLEPAVEFDQSAKRAISEQLTRFGRDEDLDQKITFLAEELGRLLQYRAQLQGNHFARRRYRDFARRWGFNDHAGAVGQNDKTATPPRRRALVIDDRLPAPDRDAGSTAIISHIQSLQRLGYDVSLIASSQFEADSKDVARFEAAGITLCSLPFYGSTEEVLWRQAGEFDVVYLHRISNAAKYGELVRQFHPKARKIYSVADLHHVRIARQGAVEERKDLLAFAKRVKFAELTAAASADAVITHSEYEAGLLKQELPKANVHRLLWAVPPHPTTVPFSRRSGFAFVGGYDHAPNLDAARWLIDSLVPLIREADPRIHCYLVGSGFPDQLKALKADGVIAMGYVADLREVFDRVRLTIAPLNYGAGVKGKIIESLAAGIPCVFTTVAAEGMGLPKELDVCRADDAPSIASTVCKLHNSKKIYEKCSRAGLDFVASELSQSSLDNSMRRVVERNL